MKNDHRQWLYKGSDGRIFEKGEDIPEGYFDSPNATEWDNMPAQPKMKEMPVWEDTEEIVADDGQPEPPEWYEEDGKFYCNLCDHAPYSREDWFADHMLKKHDVVIKGIVGIK
jgi:hypothetical protein